jgi:predicted AAA+ superfamily ATPase
VKISSVPETLEMLRSIDTDIVRWYFLAINHVDKTIFLLTYFGRIQAIVSIMGPYRSGKSFLLDQLIPHEPGILPFKVLYSAVTIQCIVRFPGSKKNILGLK